MAIILDMSHRQQDRQTDRGERLRRSLDASSPLPPSPLQSAKWTCSDFAQKSALLVRKTPHHLSHPSFQHTLFPSTQKHLHMGLLTLVEDRPTPSAVYNWRVYACAIVASFASCMIGYDSAFIGTTLALPAFAGEFGFTKMSASHLAFVKSNIVSVYQGKACYSSVSKC
jgi:hypothetical protein